MSIRFSSRFQNVKGQLFEQDDTSGNGPEDFIAQGYDFWAWSDMFYPDPSFPESVKNAVIEAVKIGRISHYEASNGSKELRTVIAQDIYDHMGIKVDPDRNVMVSTGAGPSILYATMPFVEEGDEILVPEPCYTCNLTGGGHVGAKVVTVPLRSEDNYQIRMEEFEKRLTDRTRLVIITNPNNPTGTVYRRKGLEDLCKFVIKNNLILIVDNINYHMVFDDIEMFHPCTYPGMWERTISLSSVSKGLGLGGLRIGQILADDKIIDKLQGAALDFLGVPPAISTVAAIAAIKDKSIIKSNFERNDRRRRLAYDYFKDIPGVSMRMTEAGIIAWLDISKLGTEMEVVRELKKRAKIVVNPGTEYGPSGAGHIRMCTSTYAKDEDAVARFVRIRDTLTEMAKEKGYC